MVEKNEFKKEEESFHIFLKIEAQLTISVEYTLKSSFFICAL